MSTVVKIWENLPSILGAAAMVLLFAAYFVMGGIPAADTLRAWLGLAMPFVEIITAIFLLRRNATILMRRPARWWLAAVFFVFFIPVLIYGFAFGVTDPIYSFIFNIMVVAASGSTFILFVFGFSVAFIRTYMARTPLRLAMMIFTMVALAYQVGLLGSIPILGEAYVFSLNYFVSQANFTVWLATHIGVLALFTRIGLLKEKLRPY